MGRRILVHLIAVLLMANSCFAASPRELRSFNIKGGTIKLDRCWRLTFDNDYTTDELGEDLRYTRSDMGLVYRPLADSLEFGINYRQIYGQTETSPWKPESRPHVNVTLRAKIFNLDVSNGSRLEYSNPENRSEFWCYGNKFALRLPLQAASLKVQPYVSHDIFVDFGDSNFARNGFSSGASVKLSQNLVGDFYYRWQTSRYGDVWRDVKMLGTSLRYRF